MDPFSENIVSTLRETGSIRRTAKVLGTNEWTIRRMIRRDPELASATEGLYSSTEGAYVPKPKDDLLDEPEGSKVTVKGDEATAVQTSTQLGSLDDLIRDAGLDPDEWVVASTSLTAREVVAGKAPDGSPNVLRLQTRRATLKRKATAAFLSPAVHVPELRRVRGARRDPNRPELIVVEGDHQAPYHDPMLDELATRFVGDLQPTEHVFLGDLADFPTISRHADHPAAMATAQESLDAAYGILRRRAEVAPDARRSLLKGNHDWRLESELLARAERMYGIRPAGDDVPALSLRRLLHLDALGVELVEHEKGWEHAEVEVVPGPRGLVVRHGWLTGANVAGRSLAKRGRSMIVGHDHSKAHAFQRDPGVDTVRQGVVAGTMSRVDDVFPHFAVLPDWHQGFVTVTRWPDGRFVVDHALYQDGALYWRDMRWA